MIWFEIAFLVFFLIAFANAFWYWLLKRAERRMSERFNDIIARVDLLQGLLLVIKQNQAIDAALRAGQVYHEEGLINHNEFDKFKKLLEDLRLDNFSRY